MSKIEDLIDKKSKKWITKKVKSRKGITDLHNNWYQACSSELGNMSKECFSARLGNSNPNKAGIGETSQVELLQKDKKYAGLIALPKSGKNSIRFYKNKNGDHRLDIEDNKSADDINIDNIKSLDALINNTFIFLKTSDIGSFSSNKGGGNQDNVKIEIDTFVKFVENKSISYNGKVAQFIIIMDGRLSEDIIIEYEKYIKDNKINNLEITSCAKLYG